MNQQIIVKNLKIFAYHGVHNFEKINGQDFYIDATLDIKDNLGFQNDDIKQILSYSDIISTIKKTFIQESYNLIEKAALEIIKNLFADFDDIISIDITLKKPNAPIKESFDYVAVHFKRNREEI